MHTRPEVRRAGVVGRPRALGLAPRDRPQPQRVRRPAGHRPRARHAQPRARAAECLVLVGERVGDHVVDATGTVLERRGAPVAATRRGMGDAPRIRTTRSGVKDGRCPHACLRARQVSPRRLRSVMRSLRQQPQLWMPCLIESVVTSHSRPHAQRQRQRTSPLPRPGRLLTRQSTIRRPWRWPWRLRAWRGIGFRFRCDSRPALVGFDALATDSESKSVNLFGYPELRC